MKILFILISAILISLGTQAQTEITVPELQEHVYFLASDSLKGRYPGTPEGKIAATYIRDQFSAAGLELAADDGFQYFHVVTNVIAGDNKLSVGDYSAVLNESFAPFAYTKNARIDAEVVFAGYGFDINNKSIIWNDYTDMDVTDKWVMILRGDPEIDSAESRYVNYSGDRDKALTARDKGAAGVLLVSGINYDEKDQLVSLNFDKTHSSAGLPIIHIKRDVANLILESHGKKIEELEKELNHHRAPLSFATEVSVFAKTEIIHERVQTQNDIGIVMGNDPVLQDEYIVIGAHYDHLGFGGPESGSRAIDTVAIHNGADDNASGVAGIIELAERFAISGNNKRSLIFVAFGAEELGLLGSKYFITNSPVNKNDITAMVNFDMIGRLDLDKPGIMIGGTGTAVESEALLNNLSHENLKLSYSPEGFGPSDHAAFYAENIPVFFISTGAHTDYHTPADDAELLNYEGEKIVLDWSYKLINELANRDTSLSFQEAGPKKRARHGYRLKVTLGIMPDFTSEIDNGLGVGGVRSDGPADKGGMKKGDIIVALDGKPVNNIYDYMNRLKKLEPGQITTVDVIRDGEKIVLIIQL